MTLSDRFWAKVDRSGDCWVWTAARNQRGYGQFAAGGRMKLAHRIAFALSAGPVPEGMNVLHRCDNPPCVRPDHLFLGTDADNVTDMLRKGRAGVWTRPDRLERGEARYNARLTDGAVRAIRASSESGSALGSRYGVSRNAIWRVRHGIGWAHVRPEPVGAP